MTQEAKIRGDKPQKDSSTGRQTRRSLQHGHGTCLQHYQAAVQLVQQGKYERALAAFEKLLPPRPMEIVERCRMYIITCQRQLDKTGLAFLTPEEHYDYAVSQIECRLLRGGARSLKSILADDPRRGLRLLRSGPAGLHHRAVQDCLDNLSQAIELNPKNRLQARSDNDFQSMVDDPRFTELLYPEIP